MIRVGDKVRFVTQDEDGVEYELAGIVSNLDDYDEHEPESIVRVMLPSLEVINVLAEDVV